MHASHAHVTLSIASLDPDHGTLRRTQCHTHAHILVRTGSTHRIARYDLTMISRIALKAEVPGLQHELAHTCTLSRATINTQPHRLAPCPRYEAPRRASIRYWST